MSIQPFQIVGVSPMKNKIINGCMRLAQRGTSFTVGQSDGKYTLDRWYLATTTTAGNFTVTQDTSVPSGTTFSNSLKITNAAGTDANPTFCGIFQAIEGYTLKQLRIGSVAVSFWVRSSKIGIYNVALSLGTQTRCWISEYTINAANTWEFKTVSIALSTVVGDNADSTNGVGARLYFSQAVGSGLRGTKDTWNTSCLLGTSSAVNWLNEQNNTFYITGVQLEGTSSATDFEVRSFDQELALCQRYFEKSYSVATAPGTNTAVGIAGGSVTVYSGNTTPATVYFRQSKRAVPVVTFWDRLGTQGAFSQYYNGSWGGDGLSSGTYLSAGDNSFLFYASSGAWVMNMHWTADAEL